MDILPEAVLSIDRQILAAIVAGVLTIAAAVIGAWLSKKWQTVRIEMKEGAFVTFRKSEVSQLAMFAKNKIYKGSFYKFSLADVLTNALEFVEGYFDHTSQAARISRPMRCFLQLDHDHPIFEEYYRKSSDNNTHESREILGVAQRIMSDLYGLNLVYCQRPDQSGGATRYFLTNLGLAVSKYLMLRA